MNTLLAEIIIPWRDRGGDPLRSINLMRVLEHWEGVIGLAPYLATDGRDGRAQFCRSAAYNRGMKMAHPDTDVYIFTEADMIVAPEQIDDAVELADKEPGLVIPFDVYHYLSESDSMKVIRGELDPVDARAEWRMADGSSIGAINVVSRKTMDAIGQWDEAFEGNWYDDDAMKIAFETCAAPTRWVNGPAWHLYHLPGHIGHHLTQEDKAATRRNRLRLASYQRAKTPEQIRELTAGAHG